MSNWSLAVDFGSTNTAAAYRIDNGPSQPVRLSDQAEQMPSAILALDTGITVGHAAIRSARLDPQRFEVSPKRRLGEMEILLGPREWKTIDLIAAVLLHVKQKGMWVAGGEVPRELILTYPQEWAMWRQDLLRQAAIRAGFDGKTIRLVTEPIAAASWYAATQPVPAGKSVAVFDFGGGTCDVAVLRASATTPGVFEVIGADGIDPLGGELLDLRLLEWTLEQLRQGDHSELADALGEPENLAAMLTLREQVRHAKHELGEYESARIPVVVGPSQAVITVTIDEFDRLIGDEIDAAVELTRRTLASTGITPADLHMLYLTGGSSHLRLVHRKMTEMLGRPPATLNDPKLVVAQGALLVPTATTKAAATPAAPGPQPQSPHFSQPNSPHPSAQLSAPTNYPGQAIHHTPSRSDQLTGNPPGVSPTAYSGSFPRPTGAGPTGPGAGSNGTGYSNSGYLNSGDPGGYQPGNTPGYRSDAYSGPSKTGPHNSGPHNSGPYSSGPANSGPYSPGPAYSGPYSPGQAYSGPHNSGPSNSGAHYSASPYTGSSNAGSGAASSAPQRKKWLIPVIAAALVAVIIIAIIIVTGSSDDPGKGLALNGKGDASMSVSPTGGDTGLVICNDGTVQESQSLCPAPTEQTQVCSDGSEVAANDACPPEEPSDCWDGSTTTDGICPALDGAAALQWVFPIPDGWTRTCDTYADNGSNYYTGELEVELCSVDQLPGARIYLSRWDSADSAKGAFTDAWGEGSSWSLDGDSEDLGTSWSTQDKNSSGVMLGVEAATYNNYPYSILVFFEDPDGAGKDMSALFEQMQQYRKSETMSWATGAS